MMFASSLKDDDMLLSTSMPDVKDVTGGKSGEGNNKSNKFAKRIASGISRNEPVANINQTIDEEES